MEGNSLYQNEHVIPVGRRTNRLCLLLIKQNPPLPRFSFVKFPTRDAPGVRCGFVLQRTFGKVHFRFSRSNWSFLLFVPFDFFFPPLYIYICLKNTGFLVLCKDKTPNKMPASLLPPRQRFGRRRAKGSQSSVLREGTSAAVASQQREKGTPVSFDYFILFLFFYCIFFLVKGGKCRSRARKYIKRLSGVPAPAGLRPQWEQSSALLPLHTAAPRKGG